MSMFTSDQPYHIAGSSTGVWIAVGHNGQLARSADNGETWGLITLTLSGTSTQKALWHAETDNNGTWVVVGNGQHILRSTDDGVTWTTLNGGALSGVFNCVATDGDGTWLAVGLSNVVWRSLDNGATWSTATLTTSTLTWIATDRVGTWVAVGFSGVAWRSVDLGTTWEAVSSGFGTTTISGIAWTGLRWVMHGGNLVRSTVDFSSTTSVTPGGTAFYRIATAGGQLFLGAPSGVVAYSYSGGGATLSTTTAISGTPHITKVGVAYVPEPLPTDPKTLVAWATNGTAYRSTDRGETWSAFGEIKVLGVPVTPQHIAAGDDGTWVALGVISGTNYIARSGDNGQTWSVAEFLDGVGTGPGGLATDGAGVWVFSYYSLGTPGTAHLFRSTDNGLTWTRIDVTLGGGSDEYVRGVFTDTNGTWFVLCRNERVLRSTDDGLTWAVESLSAFASQAINLMASDGGGVWVAVGTGGVLVRSTDAGATWGSAVTTTMGATHITRLVHAGGGDWFISDASLTRAYSSDSGVSWSAAGTFSGNMGLGGSAVFPASDGSGFVYMPLDVSAGSVHRVSYDAGASWSPSTPVAGKISRVAFGPTGTPDPLPPDPEDPLPDDPEGAEVWLAGGFVSGAGTLHRSVDNGATWRQLYVAPTFSGVWAVASDDLGRWILACFTNKLFRSIDNGRTWVQINPNLPPTSPARCIATNGAGVWVVGGDGGSLSRSTDHGQTWSAVAHGLAGAIGTPRIQGIATDRAGVWVAVTSNYYVLRSTDNGATWTQSLPGGHPGVGWVGVGTDRAGEWWITGDVPEQLLLSVDNGESWSAQPGFFSDVSSSMTYGVETDRAGTWLITSDTNTRRKSVENVGVENVWYSLPYGGVRSVATDAAGVWLASGSVGGAGPTTLSTGVLSRSVDNGASFTTLPVSGTTAVAYGVFAETLPVDPPPDGPVDPEPEPEPQIWIAAGDSGKVRRSVDHGATWAAVDAGFTVESVFAAAADATGVVLVGGEAGEMRRSIDQGVMWATVEPGFGLSDIRGIATDGHETWVAVGTAGKIARSEDGGATWSPITTSLGDTADFEAVATNRTGVWVAVGKFGDLILSTNNGASWVTVDSGFTEDIHAVAYRSGVWVAAGFGGQIRRSVNNGLTWTEVGDAVGILRAVAASGSAWVVAGWLGEMLRSTDAGATWAAIDSDFGTAGVNALAAAPDGVWMSGGDDALFLRRSANDGATWVEVAGEFDDGDFVHALCYIPESMMDFDEDIDLESIASGDDEYEHDGDAEYLLSEGDGLPEEIFISSTATLYSNGSSSDYTVIATVKDLTSEAAATDEISEFSTYTLESAGVADDEISSTTDSVHDLLSEASGLGTVSEYHALDLLSEATATDEISEEAVHDLLSEATADDEISGFAASFEDLLSAALADDELFAGGTTTVNVDEVAFGDSETFFHNPGAVAWVLNTESNGVSWYSNYHFTGMTQVGDRVLMVGPMGLCEVTGNLDLDDDIQANVTYGFVDFGDEQKKRIDRLNFGYTADGLLQATVETYGQGYPAYTYEMEARTAEMPRNNRIRPGKGLNARYWRIGIENVDGCAFSVEDISADIVPSARRL